MESVKFTRQNSGYVYKRKNFFSKPDFTLRLDDIEGARPRPRKNHLGKRCTNPLNPNYILPTDKSFDRTCYQNEGLQKTRTWFHQNTDIEGSSCTLLPRKIGENNYGSKVVERARQTRSRKVVRDPLQIRDINYNTDNVHMFRTSRNPTNPVQPEYLWDSTHSKNALLGHIEKSVSTRKIRNLNIKSKRNSDIPGATVVHNRYERTRKARNPADISDITGAQASTKKRFRTKRQTCPLNPVYSHHNYFQPLDTPR